MEQIYLDYNATTPVDPLVIDAIRPYLEHHFGNPSSIHEYGILTKLAVEKAREQVAALIGAHSDEIVFTSGGSESNNMAIKGAALAAMNKGRHIITSSVEHPAVTEVCRYLEKSGFTVTFLPVDQYGMVNPVDVQKAITHQTILISIMHANNETGTIQPVEEIGKIARSAGILFHTDAAQSVGKIPVNVTGMQVDLLSVAGHKLYAPKGIGALYIRRGVSLEKLIHGADHESNLRAGTENVMHIAGLGKAAEILTIGQSATNSPGGAESVDHQVNMQLLRDRLHQGIAKAIPEVRLNGHPDFRLPNTLSLGFPGIEAGMMLQAMKGVAASAGAACHTDQPGVSGVLAAMMVPATYALGTIRFSTGRMTTPEEVEMAVPVIIDAYHRLKRESADQAANPVTDAHESYKLTRYTHSLGCACKIRPQLLENILKGLPAKQHPDILVGHETSDDAAVYRIDETRALVQTVDFIPPVVDDPYMYGAIAAANALSDVYAMGGSPLFALSVVAFPDGQLPVSVLQDILRGANDKVAEAGIQIVGGHSIEDLEPKFGLVVTGMVHPNQVLRNSGAMPGDALILTKPLGTGIITTAIKRGLATEDEINTVMSVMARLNKLPFESVSDLQIHACTDVTGFGLLGHLKEMVAGSGVHAYIDPFAVPVLEAAWKYASAGTIPGGTKNNLDYVANLVHWVTSASGILKFILADAQTSGGLLISLPEIQAPQLLRRLHAMGITDAAVIGTIRAGEPGISV